MTDNLFARFPALRHLLGTQSSALDTEEVPLGVEAAHCVTPVEPEERDDVERSALYRMIAWPLFAAVGFFILATDLFRHDDPPYIPVQRGALVEIDGYLQAKRVGCEGDHPYLRAAGHARECFTLRDDGTWQWSRAY